MDNKNKNKNNLIRIISLETSKFCCLLSIILLPNLNS